MLNPYANTSRHGGQLQHLANLVNLLYLDSKQACLARTLYLASEPRKLFNPDTKPSVVNLVSPLNQDANPDRPSELALIGFET